jgi:hypothetical protein
MNLKLVFRIFAGFAAFFALMSLLATDAMMESYGMEMSSESNLLIQFMVMVQLMFAIVVWQLPSWLGENLAKAGPTFILLSLLPVAMNIFHVATGALPASVAQIVESGVWVVFAALFYFYSKKS